ncbi:hypothetical protein GCM10022419_129620 [Nonomuraea rosea]|uniref:Secreted protein n=1 Tax=Nonomuraea rosea TaxID=638574 RepID=A0ABP6ZYT8_9ACTN
MAMTLCAVATAVPRSEGEGGSVTWALALVTPAGAVMVRANATMAAVPNLSLGFTLVAPQGGGVDEPLPAGVH